MCGIAGFQGAYNPSLLDEMNRRITHRGPDDAGVWFHEPSQTGLAHRRLSIIDLSAAGHQPMHSADQQATIVYNGEIYNFREIRADLEARGHSFRGNSDTEVLLYAYLTHGVDMLSKLNGIFALAIYDHRDQSLLLARDGLGVKPLYFAETRSGIIFASEMKALLRCDELDWTLNAHALHAYLTFLWSPSPYTLLKQVEKLQPGCAMIVKQGRITRKWQYYELPFSTIRNARPKDLVDEFRDQFEAAVQRQMISDVEVGAFLSGGLDSSSIVALARKHYDRGRLKCFTMGFKEGEYAKEGIADDLPYAKQAAKHLDVELHVLNVESSLVKYMEGMVYHLDEPQGDLAPINGYLISRFARDMGIKVLLSGSGGDDVLAGYRRHKALMLERYWAWLPRPLRQMLKTGSKLLPQNKQLTRRIAKAFSHAGEDQMSRIITYFYWLPERLSAGLLHPDLRADLPGVDQTFRFYTDQMPTKTSNLEKMLFLENKFFQADHNLNYTDKTSMATGVEARVPFLDYEFVKYCSTLPAAAKITGPGGKWILRKAMEGILPHEVLYRPKSGFGAPVRNWLRGDLKGYVDDMLSGDTLKKRGIFDPAAVQQLIRDDRSGKFDASYPILTLICIETWFRIFKDSANSEAYSLAP